MCAYRDALCSYDQALEAAEKVASETEPATLWEIECKRGAVATTLGDYDTALAAYQAVLRLVGHDASKPNIAGALVRSAARRSGR